MNKKRIICMALGIIGTIVNFLFANYPAMLWSLSYAVLATIEFD